MKLNIIIEVKDSGERYAAETKFSHLKCTEFAYGKRVI